MIAPALAPATLLILFMTPAVSNTCQINKGKLYDFHVHERSLVVISYIVI